MEVKPGYKETEVGVIPSEWGVKRLAELFDFSGGLSASRDQLSNVGFCYLHYGDIHKSSRPYIDTSDNHGIPKLDIPLKAVSSKSLLGDGDVVFVDASEDDEGASKHVVVVNKQNIPFISGLHTIVAKSKTNEVVHEYRQYCFQTRSIRDQFLYYAVGTKVKGISKSNIPKLFLPLPPCCEQEAIAEALSDADALIESLDQLIVKKRALKQAAMQQLLTGKKRLPGFNGEWELKRLGDVADIISGGTPKTTEPLFWNGDIKWCTPTDITACQAKYLFETDRTISRLGLDNCGARLLPVGALLLCSRATIGEIKIASCEVCTNQGFKSLVCRPNMNNEYLYYKMLTMKQQMVERAFGSTFLEISTTNIASLDLSLPGLLEQAAIATVLSDIDSELDALEARREKAKCIKQGMMQELLTGKTRLI